MFVYFMIRGDNLDPTKATKALSITPTKTWVKGDILKGTAIRRKTNCWQIGGDPFNAVELEPIVISVLEQVAHVTHEIKNICTKTGATATLFCAIYMSNSTRPAICLSKGTLSLLNKLGASLDIDLY